MDPALLASVCVLARLDAVWLSCSEIPITISESASTVSSNTNTSNPTFRSRSNMSSRGAVVSATKLEAISASSLPMATTGFSFMSNMPPAVMAT